MIKHDGWIAKQVGMIEPFMPVKVRQNVLSYGVSSYGYDIRLSEKHFGLIERKNATYKKIVDPKNFNTKIFFQKLEPIDEIEHKFFIMPPHSYALGVSYEKVTIPKNVMAIVLGKSTYARCGLICNTTPLEPGWSGHITLEFSNPTSSSIRVYANEGIAQVIFFEGEPCVRPYGKGKYQNQEHEVTHAKI